MMSSSDVARRPESSAPPLPVAGTTVVGPGSNSMSRLSEDSEDSSPGLIKPGSTGKCRTSTKQVVQAHIDDSYA